eukprot:5710422-Alexandrium_andersonii.AAC.1
MLRATDPLFEALTVSYSGQYRKHAKHRSDCKQDAHGQAAISTTHVVMRRLRSNSGRSSCTCTQPHIVMEGDKRREPAQAKGERFTTCKYRQATTCNAHAAAPRVPTEAMPSAHARAKSGPRMQPSMQPLHHRHAA